MDWPQMKPYAVFTAIGTTIVLLGNVVGAGERLEPWFYSSHGYVRDEVNPILIIGLENQYAILEVKQAAIKVRMQMAADRLRANPADTLLQSTWEDANQDFQDVEFTKSDVQCTIRQAKGLGCGGR